MPLCSKPLGAALSIAAIATAAVTMASPVRAQQEPGAAQQTAPQTGTPTAPQAGPSNGQPPATAAPPPTPPDRTASAPPPRRTARPRSASSAVVSAKVNLRSGPGTDSEIVATIPAGSMVHVNECRGEWCAVTWNGQSGYAITRNLNLGVSRQARGYPPQPGYPADYPPGVYEPGYAPPVVYGPAYYYGPRVYYYGPGWGWRRHWW